MSAIEDSPEAIARDVAKIARLSAVPSLLRVVCQTTGMGFAAVARVTDGTWTACAVQDDIQFGLLPGGQLDVQTTLCSESRAARAPVAIDNASQDATYRDHHTPRIYNIQSYISVPIILKNGDYFGNLCAIDPRPALVSDSRTVNMFQLFAELISLQLDNEERHRETESELADARTVAELREQFIAVLGHDLRNPLASVAAAAEVLLRGGAQTNLVSMGARLKSTTKRMSKLIDDVLDFARSRMGAGIGVNLVLTNDLEAALADVVGEMRAAYPGHQLLDNIHVPGAASCDRGRIQQLLSNLLGNALTHGLAQEPVLVDALVEGEALVLTVGNSGAPIAAENIGKVFEPYWRPANSLPGGGLGLGLHICSQIVKAHRGVLSVTSSAEDGTRFTARLPIMV